LFPLISLVKELRTLGSLLNVVNVIKFGFTLNSLLLATLAVMNWLKEESWR